VLLIRVGYISGERLRKTIGVSAEPSKLYSSINCMVEIAK
jgi:hypothetical protein